MSEQQRLDRDEYVRRWKQASRAILWGYFAPLLAATWVGLGLLVLWQPAGRVGALAWFLWVSSLLFTVVAGGLAGFADVEATDALKYPHVWAHEYREPWLVSTRREAD